MDTQPKQPKFYTLGEIIADRSPRPEAIIEGGVLNAESLLLIAGQQKAKKSFLAMNMAVAIAAGKPFACFTVRRPRKVLVLAAEGGVYSNIERLQKMCSCLQQPPIDNIQFCFDSRWKFDHNSLFAEIESIIGEKKPDVVIIDPLVKFHSSDENSAKEMTLVLERIRNIITDKKVSVILVHHVGKSIGNGARGSSAILGEYDSYIQIEKQKENQKLEFDMRHSETPDPIVIKFNAETFWFEKEESTNPLIKILQENGPLDKKTLSLKLVEVAGFATDKSAYNRIRKDLDKGIIVECNGGVCLP